MSNTGVKKILVVEDSPTVAMTVQKILNSDPELMVIGIAKNGREAIKLARKFQPDLITMDVNLPEMDGLEATKKIMASCPTPILILTSSSFKNEKDKVFHAISCGALEVGSKDDLLDLSASEISNNLIQKVKFLSGIKVIRHLQVKVSSKTELPPLDSRMEKDPERVVAIVGSTGAPKAISQILKRFPKSFPCGILIMIHIAHGFLEGCVHWLQGLCTIPVKVAAHGEPILPGIVYMAPTGLHMRVNKDRTIDLADDPPHHGFRPNGDYLLESVANSYGKNSIGIILTGMGRDGTAGIQEIKKCGGRTIAQDEATSAIFGMPKVAIETGAIDSVLSLDRIADGILGLLRNGSHDR